MHGYDFLSSVVYAYLDNMRDRDCCGGLLAFINRTIVRLRRQAETIMGIIGMCLACKYEDG